MDPQTTSSDTHLLGITAHCIGCIPVLNNMTILESGTTLETIVKCWPLLLVVGGIEAFINRHGFLWPILLTGLGVIFLLSNFNIIQMSIWSAVSRLWPVLLIALGLNLLIGRTRGWLSAVLGIGLGLLLVAACLWLLAVRLPQTTSNMQTLDIPAANVQTVNGSIEMTAGSLQLSTMDGGKQPAARSSGARHSRTDQQNFQRPTGCGLYRFQFGWQLHGCERYR